MNRYPHQSSERSHTFLSSFSVQGKVSFPILKIVAELSSEKMIVQALIFGNVPGRVTEAEQNSFMGMNSNRSDGEFLRYLLRSQSPGKSPQHLKLRCCGFTGNFSTASTILSIHLRLLPLLSALKR